MNRKIFPAQCVPTHCCVVVELVAKGLAIAPVRTGGRQLQARPSSQKKNAGAKVVS
jgi:hypothetical protein